MPAYNSFDEAYAASRSDVNSMVTFKNVGWTNYNEIQQYIDSEQWANALGKVKAVLGALLYCMDYFCDTAHGTPYENAFNDMGYWNDQAISGAGVDMDAMLNAMIAATPSEVEYFVGLVDAYRQSMWNRPFNREFYAALARGFALWL